MRGQSSITFSELQTDPRSVIIVSRQTPLPPSLRRIGEFLQARWPDIRVRFLGNERHLSDALRTDPPDLLLLAEEVADQRLLALASEQMSPRTHVARIRESGALETLFLSLPTLSGTDCLAGRVVDLLERRSRNQAKRRLHKLQLDRLTRKNERLKQLSVEDPLTRVFNRRGFHRFFRAEWSRASRYHADIACVLVDIDDFKRLNDTYGHPLGDRVLRRFADMLRSSCRASDILGRIGGEEFCIALPSCNEHQAYLWAEKLRRRIEATPLYAETATIRITASFGVASAQTTLRDEHELIELADRAMLIAKHSGRNRVVAASTTQGGKPGETKLHPASRIVRLLLESLAIRDPATARHSQRVSQYATKSGSLKSLASCTTSAKWEYPIAFCKSRVHSSRPNGKS
jgi:diguanylate cyclase (GGDEF)-like protein